MSCRLRLNAMSTNFSDFALSTEQRLHLEQISAATGKSPTEVLDQLLRQFPVTTSTADRSSGRHTLYEAFADDGSIGLINDGPVDVSTNPKYMEGFGQGDR